MIICAGYSCSAKYSLITFLVITSFDVWLIQPLILSKVDFCFFNKVKSDVSIMMYRRLTPLALAAESTSSISCKPSAFAASAQSAEDFFLLSAGIPQPTNSVVTMPLLFFADKLKPARLIYCIAHHSIRPRTALYTKSWSLKARFSNSICSASPCASRSRFLYS